MDNDELTDSQYWERHWDDTQQVRPVTERDPFYGRDGILMRALRRHADLRHARTVLELGGGASVRLVSLIKWLPAEGTAIDFSERGLAQLHALCAANRCRATTVLADALEWDPGDARFDLIVHWGLLEHFPDPYPILRRCRELLSPGGTLLFTMPNMEAWGASLWRRFAPLNWSHHIFHPDERLAEACARAGLEPPRKFYFGYPLVHITDWEGEGRLVRLGSRVMAKVALAAAVAGWVLPMYDRGTRRISVERAFVTRAPQG